MLASLLSRMEAARAAAAGFIGRVVTGTDPERRLATFGDGARWYERPSAMQARLALRRLYEMAREGTTTSEADCPGKPIGAWSRGAVGRSSRTSRQAAARRYSPSPRRANGSSFS
jgi:hypothetical protein